MGLASICERRWLSTQEGDCPIGRWYVLMCAMLKIQSGGRRTTGIQTEFRPTDQASVRFEQLR